MRVLENTDKGEPDFPIKYYCVQPNKWTFQSDKIREWVESHLEGDVLNACAGKTKLNHERKIHRNDINPERDADTHYDVLELTEWLEPNSFDTVVYDPPFSKAQADSTYDGISVTDEGKAMRVFDQLLRPGGKVVKFGFSTTGMPGELDYVRKEVAIFNTLGRMNDWLAVVDQRMCHDMREWE